MLCWQNTTGIKKQDILLYLVSNEESLIEDTAFKLGS